MFDRPFGSPLDPVKRKPPLGPLGALSAPQAPIAFPQPPMAPVDPPAAPTGMLSPTLPEPPAQVKRKRLNPFDKEHISKTLMDISVGLGSGGNLMQGIAAAGQNVAGSMAAYSKAQRGTDEIGGPDNAFRVHTDADGNQTFKPIPELQQYLGDKKKRDSAPKPGESMDYVGNMMYSIEQLDPAQRPGALLLMKQQGKDAGYDVSGVPDEYSPTFAKAAIAQTIGARQGSANAAAADRYNRSDADRDEARRDRQAIAQAGLGLRREAAGRAAAKHNKSMRSAPPSARKRKGTDDLNYF